MASDTSEVFRSASDIPRVFRKPLTTRTPAEDLQKNDDTSGCTRAPSEVYYSLSELVRDFGPNVDALLMDVSSSISFAT